METGMVTAHETVEQAQYLTFYLADEEYAIGILQVREVIEYDFISKVPTTPPCIRGVINLRGSIVPVIDLAVKFGFRETQVTKWTCLVIVEVDVDGDCVVMGIMADAIGQVIDLLPQDIAAPPAFGPKIKVEYLRGIATVAKKFILILNTVHVLSTIQHAEGVTAHGTDRESCAHSPVG
jgi:purine-binding chemotaxis protein CheW